MAKGKKISAKDLREEIEAANTIAKDNIRQLEKQLTSLHNIFDLRKKQILQEDILNQKMIMQENTDEIILAHKIKQDKISKYLLDKYEKQSDAQHEIYKNSEKTLKAQKSILDIVKQTANTFGNINSGLGQFLMKSDAAIKSVNLELGLSGERAAMMRTSFEDSAGFAARLGVNMENLTQMTTAYAEETGRARIHNEANLKAMSMIAKGTTLGVDGAAQMAAQYEMMGFNAVDTAEEVQRIVDTTERMGVNTAKVLKAVNKNFKALQKFTFRGGSQGIADMAMYAEKFKINMDEVMNAMEKGRSLDSVIEMSAQLQVLGGQFANLADPMSMLFESRNDPEAYTKRINEMTKGMVTMNKTAQGFELQIASPMAQDQLKQAAAALGMTTDELTQQAFRMREIQQTRSQMFSKGFTSDEKEIIEGLAKFDKTTGKMMVEIGGVATNVSRLGKNDIQRLKQQQKSLDDRAKDAQTFDEAFSNMILELKSSLLPMVRGINDVLSFIRPIMSSIGDWVGDLGKTSKEFLKVGGMFMAAGTIIAPALMAIKTMRGLSALGGLAKGGGLLSGAGSAAGSAAKGGGGLLGKAGSTAKGGGMMKGGAGVGAAALGIGAGIGVAAAGISKLADSMSKLSPEQAETLENIAMTLAISMPAAAIGIGVVAAVAAPAAVPLLALGVALLMIGGAVGVAAAGIGYMAEGFASLDGVDLSGIGDGMLKFSAASLALANPLGMIGMASMSASVMAIGANAANMERVGNAFGQIGAVLQGSASQFKEVRDTIKSIASTEVGSNSAISQLTEMLSKPLRVEFPEGEVGIVANIDLSMGGDNFITQVSKKIPARIVDLQQAKA